MVGWLFETQFMVDLGSLKVDYSDLLVVIPAEGVNRSFMRLAGIFTSTRRILCPTLRSLATVHSAA